MAKCGVFFGSPTGQKTTSPNAWGYYVIDQNLSEKQPTTVGAAPQAPGQDKSMAGWSDWLIANVSMPMNAPAGFF